MGFWSTPGGWTLITVAQIVLVVLTLLLTSAFHMPRSVGIFRKAGFAVEPYPVDWRTGGPGELLAFSPFALDGLERTEVAVREYLGLVAYRISGRTSELFPGPNPE